MANSEGQPVSAVQQYIDAFNKGDANAMAAMCANILPPVGGEFAVGLLEFRPTDGGGSRCDKRLARQSRLFRSAPGERSLL